MACDNPVKTKITMSYESSNLESVTWIPVQFVKMSPF